MRTTLWILAICALALGLSSSVAAQPPCQPMCGEDPEDGGDAPWEGYLPILGMLAELLPFALVGLALGRRLHR